MPSILVIDDKDTMRAMLSQALTDEGYQVDVVEDGKKGIELARLKNYDLALTDLIREAVPAPYTVPWVAAKLMEGDPEIAALMEKVLTAPQWERIRSLLVAHEDSLHAVVCSRYDWIEEVTRSAVSRFRMGQVVMTDRTPTGSTATGFSMKTCLPASIAAFR